MDNEGFVKGTVDVRTVGDSLSVTVTGDAEFLNASFTEAFRDGLEGALIAQGFPLALSD